MAQGRLSVRERYEILSKNPSRVAWENGRPSRWRFRSPQK
jgi:hypothetical protein